MIFKKINLAAIIIILSLAAGSFSLAGPLDQDVKDIINDQAERAGSGAGYEIVQEEGILNVIQLAINAFLSLLGVIFLIYIIYAGYNWMTARGEEEKVEKAKETLNRAMIGVIIIIAAYAISYFVISRLEQGTLRNGATVEYEEYDMY